MKILALDTSERQFSVAILDGDSPLMEQVFAHCSDAATFSPPDTTPGVAVSLFTTLHRLLNQAGWKISDVELLAVAKGPGSFTGLRTGIVAAKTIAYARKISVQGVNTLEAMANQLGQHLEADDNQGTKLKNLSVHCVINAQRQQLFTSKYQLQADLNGRFLVQEVSNSRIMNREAWIAELVAGDWVTGTGLKPLFESLHSLPINIAPQSLWPSRASSIGRIAFRDFQAGCRDDCWSLEPLYFRPSYADEN